MAIRMLIKHGFLILVFLGGYGRVEGQIHITASLLSKNAVASIASERVSRRLGLWVVATYNRGHSTRNVSRYLVAHALREKGIMVYDATTAQMIVSQERRHNPWRSAGQLVSLFAFSAAILNETEAGQELMGPTGRKAIVSFLPILPRLGDALVSRAPDSKENILELSQPEVLSLEPGEAGAMRVFSSPSEPTTVYAVVQ